MQLKDLLPPMQFKPRKGAIVTDTPWSIPPFSNWSIWLLTQTCQCVFTWLCQCHLELEGDKRLSSFYFGHCFLSKSFDHIIKDASLFHLKSSSSHKLNYFPTSTPSRHTFQHHGWSIASHQSLTYKYGRPSTSGRLWTWKDFHNYFEPTWCPVTFPFSFIYSFVHFSNLQYVS